MPLAPEEYPVYLHTQPSSYRAIKLYTDFGFSLLTGGRVGQRENQLAQSLPILREVMPPAAYGRLTFAPAPEELLSAAASRKSANFSAAILRAVFTINESVPGLHRPDFLV